MRLLDNLRVALRRLRIRPVRSFLLLQGTIWGVAVAIFPSATIEGTKSAVAERGSDFGADRIAITLDPTAVDPKPLVEEDVVLVRAALVRDGVPVVALSGIAVRPSDAKTSRTPAAVLMGPPNAYRARSLVLAAGREVDPSAKERETVVEALLADELERGAGGKPHGIGATIGLPGEGMAVVVGALAPRTPLQRRLNDLGFDTGHPVFQGVTGNLLVNLGVPIEDDEWKRSDRCAYVAPRAVTATASRPVDWIFLRVPPESVSSAAKSVKKTMRVLGKSVLAFYPPVYPIFLSRDIDRFRTVAFALFVACLSMSAVVMAGVALLAAIRRASEIAIHRVEGATEGDVLVQFLAEALVLSLLGSLVGWALACGLAQLRIAIEPMAGMTWRFPWAYAVPTLVVAVVVGCLASLLPALRAARRSPVASLADE
jgi:hypothetical protein